MTAIAVAIAGGHTAGHVSIGLAIAQGLLELTPNARILFCGAHGGVEVPMARAAGFATESVWGRSLVRERSLRAILQNLTVVPLMTAAGVVQARTLLSQFSPDVVVGVGAFASVPWLLAAHLQGVPTVVHEANARPGVANRFLCRRATLTCVGDAAAKHWLGGQNLEVTGTPVYVPPEHPLELDIQKVRQDLGFEPVDPMLLVSGGTLGSSLLNDWMVRSHHALQAQGVQVLWQCGATQLRSSMSRVPATSRLRIVPFISDIHSAYRAADLVISAAGASTLAELLHWKRPAIVVPSLGVTDEHQLLTARRALAQGWRVCMPDQVATELLPWVLGLISDCSALTELAGAPRTQAPPNPARTIAERILEIATRKRAVA